MPNRAEAYLQACQGMRRRQIWRLLEKRELQQCVGLPVPTILLSSGLEPEAVRSDERYVDTVVTSS